MDLRTSGPLRAFRDRYAASYAGVSYDLAPGAAGVDPRFLLSAPDLQGRLVLVSPERGTRVPLVRRTPFRVVPVTPLMRDARGHAAGGGIVFSTFDLDDPAREALLRDLAVGDAIVLNAAIERLPEVVVRRPFDDSAAS